MEIRHLRYFIAIAEEKSFTRASGRLYVSQPALSRQMRDLEESLDVQLLVRSAAGVELSPAGEAFLAGARRVVEEFDGLNILMRPFLEGQSLKVAYLASSLTGPIGKVIRRFEQENPKLQLEIFEMTPGRMLDALKAKQLDIALIGHACPTLDGDFELRFIGSLGMSAVVPEDHTLAKRTSVHLAELEGNSFIGLEPTEFPGRIDLMDAACERAGFKPHWAFYADGLVSQLTLVAQRKGVTIMPTEVATLPHPGSVFVQLLDEGLAVHFHAAIRPGDDRVAIQSFLDYCVHLFRNPDDPQKCVRETLPSA